MGRYQLKRSIATGGMGEVFEAETVGEGAFSRRVAVKQLRREVVERPEFLRMFIDEAQIASRLHHANIVSILDFGIAEGVPFQVLEYVDGITVAEAGHRAGGRFPVHVALHICTEVAHALHHAHEARDAQGAALGVIHRDVNPNNILVSWEGDVKLSDFGIAFARNRQGKTEVGIAKGTPAFMAPEQYVGGAADHRTDIFALGCVLHCLVTGTSPLSAEGAVTGLLAGRAVPLSPELTPDILPLLERALAPLKADRFRTADEMARELGKALSPRLEGDARSGFRAWLSSLAPKTPPSRGLEGLMSAALNGTTGTVQELEGMATKPSRPVSLPLATPGRRRGWALAAGAVAIAAAATWGYRAWTQRAPQAVPEPAIAAAPPAAQPPTLEPAPPPPHEEPPPALVKAHPSHRASARPKPPEGAGLVVIGGEGAYRAEIRIDGESRGYAPKTLEVASGKHVCELVTPSGQHLGPHAIDVSARNTSADPIRWMIPGVP
jgi:serine/threonine protein kinase